ncbi:CoA transferase [Actinomadura madurae]|nr:CoA transferase [Actinomadura madurae]MCQ0009433.1 CoA transferase [Actinomadura madurae]
MKGIPSARRSAERSARPGRLDDPGRPLASSLLGEFGAEVIKIEHPADGDPARRYPPLEDGESAAWSMLARAKRSVTIDLHHAEAAALVGGWPRPRTSW